jgi:hypothetical protein
MSQPAELHLQHDCNSCPDPALPIEQKALDVPCCVKTFVWPAALDNTTHLRLKQAAQMEVTIPTSRSFFFLPRLSIGNRCSMRNRRPPYNRKPTAAHRLTAARNAALMMWLTCSAPSLVAMDS